MTDVRARLDARLDPGELQDVIGQYKYGRYLEDKSLPHEGSRRLLLDHAQDFLSRDDAKCAAAFSPAGELLGFLTFTLSAWDTKHFGFNFAVIDSMITRELEYDHKVEVANALLQQFDEWCQSANIRFASIRVPVLDLPVIHSFEQSGFHYIETWVYTKYDLRKLDGSTPVPCELRMARPEDCRSMLEYSKGAFATHRFYADTRFGKDKADALYEKWIQSAFDDPHQQILVQEIENKPAAFVISYEEDLRPYFGLRFAIWKMVLLDPAKRGKGLGGDFYTAIMQKQHGKGIDIMDAGLSLRNVHSMNLCIKMNFKVVSTVATYHKWLK